jgi:recombinase-like zinc beta ribbon protein
VWIGRRRALALPKRRFATTRDYPELGQSRLRRDVGRSAASPRAADQFSRTDLPNNDRRHSMPATRRLVVEKRTTTQKRAPRRATTRTLGVILTTVTTRPDLCRPEPPYPLSFHGENRRPPNGRHQSSGAIREGPLLKGLATCGHCGRRLSTHATGHSASPGYHCAGARRGVYCLSVDAVEIDAAVARAVLDALAPAGLEAALSAAERPAADHDRTLALWHHAVERASYRAQRAKNRYMAVDPDNRLVASARQATCGAILSRIMPQVPRL